MKLVASKISLLASYDRTVHDIDDFILDDRWFQLNNFLNC